MFVGRAGLKHTDWNFGGHSTLLRLCPLESSNSFVVLCCSAVNWDAVFRHHGMKKFVIQTRMCRNVGVLRLFPGITEMTVSGAGINSKRSIEILAVSDGLHHTSLSSAA